MHGHWSAGSGAFTSDNALLQADLPGGAAIIREMDHAAAPLDIPSLTSKRKWA